MKRLIDILMAVSIFSLAFVIPIGLNQLINTAPTEDQAGYAQSENEHTAQAAEHIKLPLDVPVPERAVLVESERQGFTEVLTYSLPKVSTEKLREYYDGEMDNLGWEKTSDEENTMAFAKEDGERRAFVTFDDNDTHPKIILEIDEHW